MNAAPSHLLYLHGFRSSPRSFKALLIQDWLRQRRPDVRWWCPQLPPSPRAAMALVEQGLADWPAGPTGRMAVIGSSLGGYYATWVAERRGCPAVLLNPAVDPARGLAAHVGEQTAFHDPTRRFVFRPEYLDELRALRADAPTRRERYLPVIATGDELLDWREMCARYPGQPTLLIQGSDHGLSDFERHLPAVLDFLHLNGKPS
jgi:predicted esterase YcpF (UPF0227 family)